ncbi:MAG: lyase family protein [Candidatus Dormibacteraeota bacterium]|nr:lyase family protein [Candidatus Dormibacteraeota bacterium]
MSQTPPEGYLGADARITKGPAPELLEAGFGLEIADARVLHRGLTVADIAHVLELAEQGVVPHLEAVRLLAALVGLLDIAAQDFPYDPRFGDAYNSRERELDRQLGTTAGWLHTGRTRREALRIATRLALREWLLDLHGAIVTLTGALVDAADAHAETVWADTTYLQPAQPSTFGHYLASFAEETLRSLERVEQAHRWADRSPAGAGGVGGTRIPLDRARLASRLGFAEAGRQTRDAMWATDGLADAVFAGVQATTTLDRLGEDLEILSSPGFGLVEVDASLCRASVLMPQKRNPYALVVIRGGASLLIGRCVGLLVAQRTPSAQTDNWLYACGEVGGALSLAGRLLNLGAAVVRTLSVDSAAMAARAAEHFAVATDIAEEITLSAGIDYRSAYRMVGQAVAAALAAGATVIDLGGIAAAARSVLGGAHDWDPGPLEAAADPRQAVSTRTCLGGAAPNAVRDHCRDVRRRLTTAQTWHAERSIAAESADAALVAEARAFLLG